MCHIPKYVRVRPHVSVLELPVKVVPPARHRRIRAYESRVRSPGREAREGNVLRTHAPCAQPEETHDEQGFCNHLADLFQ